jgi:hypothetical protein
MVKSSITEVQYLFYSKYNDNPRAKINELHKSQSLYKNRDSTTKLIREAIEKRIIVGPFIFCNSGIEVELKSEKEVEDPIEYLIVCKKDLAVTRAIALFGEYSFLCFRKGASELTYAEAIKPTLNSPYTIENMRLEKKGKLPIDQYPCCWDDLDWKIYHLMRNPRVSFAKISGVLKSSEGLDITWKTIETRYYKIIEDCKVMNAFFPKGMDKYFQTFLTLKTDYENDLREELQKLDRTTYLYKIGNMILLNLFLDNNIDYRVFVKFKKRGLIQDLHVSIPLYFWTPFPV